MLGSPIDITKLKGDLSKLLTACEKIASICTNLADRDSLLYSIATTKEALSKFEQAADRFAANPSEAYAKTAYEMTAKELNEEVHKDYIGYLVHIPSSCSVFCVFSVCFGFSLIHKDV